MQSPNLLQTFSLHCSQQKIKQLSPAGDAAPVGATEVGGIAGARDGEVGALVLRLVGAVVAVGVAVAPPVLRDAPPALGALESKVARLQNLIPSFPWIAPGWRAWGAIISPNAKIQFRGRHMYMAP